MSLTEVREPELKTGAIACSSALWQRVLCAWLAGWMVLMVPVRGAHAELVSTAEVPAAGSAADGGAASAADDSAEAVRIAGLRSELAALIEREDAAAQLQRFGISREEALRRIAALSDAEVQTTHDRLANLPAGAGIIEVLVIILLFTVLVLVITDLLGYTDVFPFINSLPRGRAKAAISATAAR
jgi:hypothetical protein